MSEDKRLFERLRMHASGGELPMHMPGHKRNMNAFPYLKMLGGECDITEIDGFDDLYDAKDVILDIERRAAKLWGAKRTLISVNGSTGGILAAVSASVKRGERVLVARNCHKSVFNAAEIAGADVETVQPAYLREWGIFGEVSAESIEKKFEEQSFAAVVVTSPTYEGIVSDIERIADVAHAHGAVLITDGAHGAHLGISGVFPPSGEETGADITVCSLHKTLPALTQAAVVHICGDRADAEEAGYQLSRFNTSSPSYPIMASVGETVRFLEEHGEDALSRLHDILLNFYDKTDGFTALEVLSPKMCKQEDICTKDISKIYFSAIKCGISGYRLKSVLHDEYGIEAEYASVSGVLAMVTVGDGEDSIGALYAAIADLDARIAKGEIGRDVSEIGAVCPTVGERVLSSCEADGREWEKIEFCRAEGRVCADGIWLYPPGIPVVAKGERISAEAMEYLCTAAECGAEIRCAHGCRDGKIRVIKA